MDKLPHNFEQIGLIKLLFPNAAVIHVRREPRDIAISNFFTDYGAKFGGMGFAYDWQWIGEQLLDHERLMAHWHRLFPGQILEVPYEELVADTETWARRMIEHLGLDWEPGGRFRTGRAAPAAGRQGLAGRAGRSVVLNQAADD